MNKIDLNWMTVQNIFSIGDEIRFDFSKHSGLNYVFGYNNDIETQEHSPDAIVAEDESKNGCGKSTIFVDSLLFGLFAKAGKDIKKTSIVNRKRKKNGLVKISFNKGEDEYMAVNGVAPTICELYKNGENITKSSVAETLKFLQDEVLCTTYAIFKNSIILSVSDTTPVYAMTKSQIREFTNSIFDLNVYGKMFKNARKRINTLDKEILKNKTTYTNNQELLTDMESKHANFEKDKSEKISKVEEDIQEKKMSKYRTIISEGYFEEKEKEINEIKDNIAVINNKITKVDDSKSSVMTTMKSMVINIKNNKKYLDNNEHVINCLCEGCRVAVQEYIPYDKVSDDIKEETGKIEELKEKVLAFGKLKTGYESEIEDLKNKLQDSENDYNRKKEIKEHNERVDIEVKALEQNLETIKLSESSFGTMLEEYNNKQKIILESLQTQNDTRKYLKCIEGMLGEDGVKSWVVNRLVDTLNNRLRYYLERMGAEYIITFDANFDYIFHTPTGEAEYFNFSAGERMRINHATLFAFKDLLSLQGNLDTSILVCDEILDVSVDSKATNALMSILNEYSKNQTVFLISHKESISNYNGFDNTIEISKREGFTTIVSDGQADFGE